MDTEEFLNALTARQQQTALSELQAATISESEAELSAELSEFAREAFGAEMRDDQLMPSYVRLPARSSPYKPIFYNYYSPQKQHQLRAGSGYTIGPGIEAAESGRGDSGDSFGGGGNDGAPFGGHWGDGDFGGENGPDYLGLVFFWSFCVVAGRFFYLYALKNLNYSSGTFVK